MTEQTLIPCKGRKRLCKSSSSLQSHKNSSDDDDNLFDSDNGDCINARNEIVEKAIVNAIPSNGMKHLTQNELLLSHKNSRDDILFDSEKEDRTKAKNKRLGVQIEVAVTSVPNKGRKCLSQTEPLLSHKNNSDDDNLIDSDKEDTTRANDKKVDSKKVIISAVPSNGRKRLCKRESLTHSSDDGLFDSDEEDIVTKNKKEEETVQNNLTSTLHLITHDDIKKDHDYGQDNEKNENETNVNDSNDDNPHIASNEHLISNHSAVITSEFDLFLSNIIINDDIHQFLYILIKCSTYIQNRTSSTLNDNNIKKKNFDTSRKHSIAGV
jgi:hypothetical protein